MLTIHANTTDMVHYSDEVYGFYRLSCRAFRLFLRRKVIRTLIEY
jgi:hypothetical protein